MSIQATDHGRGPVVVLLHGFCETNEIWSAFEEHLSYHFRVICPDLPGFGESPLPKGDFTLETIAEQLHDWLQSIDIKECVMIGHSLGGYITVEFAEAYPEMLQGFGMFHSTAFADTEDRKQTRNKVIEFVEKHGVNTFIESFVSDMFYQKRHHELQAEIQEAKRICKQTAKESLIAYTKAMRDRNDRAHVLEEFKKPVLYIAGDEDKFVSLESTKAQCFLPEKHDVHILAHTGHMGFLEREEDCLQIVENFLKEKIFG